VRTTDTDTSCDATTDWYGQGRRRREAIRHNLRGFWAAAERRDVDRETIYDEADAHESDLSTDRRGEIECKAEGAKLPYRDLLAFTLFEEEVLSDGCSVAVATGEAAATGDTVFFKQSDKRGSEEFDGEYHHGHQQINVVRVEQPEGLNRVVGVAAAGSTALKMGMNDEGVAVGSNFAHSTTYDEDDESDPLSWAAVSRGEYMRQGLLHGDSAVDVAQHIASKLFEEPMTSPGSITIADASRAVVLEGEFTHLASEWVEDGVVTRANKFELLDDLSPPESEIPSSYRRYGRLTDILDERAGEVTVETMRDLSVDHANGPGPDSVCRHQEADYTDATSLSSAVFDIDGENPERSDVYVALGRPCHAWRTEEGDGWVRLTPSVTAEDVPERFRSGEAWLDHYVEEPYEEKAAETNVD
jgi:hypothetical protein